jgi:O-antigen ligase/polysaccharide polymerase Wzy-like membrane protein
MNTATEKLNIENAQPALASSRNLKVLLGFAAFGVLLSFGAYFVSGDFERIGFFPLMALIILIVPLTILTVVGLRQGVRHFASLRAGWTWWHWPLALLVLSTLVFRVRNNQEVTSAPIDAWALLRIGPEAIVAGVLGWRLLNRETTWRHSLFNGLVCLLAIFAFICVISSIWSVYPAWTLYKSLEYLLDVATLAAILATVSSMEEIRRLGNWIWFLYALDLVWCWISAVIWPTEALDELGRLSSPWPEISYNSLGASSALVSIVALARLFRKPEKSERAWYTLLLVFGLITLLASQTRNAMMGFVVGAFLVFIFERKAWIGIGIGLAGILGRVFYLVFSLASVPSLSELPAVLVGPRVLQFLARDQTDTQISGLSGRGDWWTFAWHQLMQRPLTGYGAYAGGRFAVLGKLGIVTSQIHSDWLEVLTDTSFWGLIPFVLAFVACWWIVARCYWDRSLAPDERDWLPEIAGLLGVITVRSFFNIEMSWHAPLFYFAILAYAEFLRRKRQAAKQILTNLSYTDLSYNDRINR